MKNRPKVRWNRALALVAGWAVIVGGAAEICAQTAAKKYTEIQVTGGGTIKGKVTFSGEVPVLELRVTADKSVCTHTEGRVRSPRLKVGPKGGVAETIIYLKNIAEGKPVAALAAPALLDQEGCVYKPFVQVAPFKGTFTITNSDKLNHNVHMKLGARSIKNLALPNTKWPKKDERQIRMTRPGIISVNCDVHSWMGAYIFVVRHPYYAVTDAEGRFELTDVPPGEYEVALWHAGWSAAIKRNAAGQVIGYNFSDPVEESMPVKIEPDGSVEVNFTLKD